MPFVVRRSLGLTAALALTLVALAALVLAASPASASESTYAQRLADRINSARASHGVGAVQWVDGTSQVARAWATHLRAANGLSHNPNLQSDLESHGSPNWMHYGENVGVGPSGNPDSVFDAYMNSSAHRANILDPKVHYVGIGVVFDSSDAWNTLDFVDSYSGSGAKPAPAPKPSSAAPAPKASTAPPAVKPAPRSTPAQRAAARAARPSAPPSPASAPSPSSAAPSPSASPSPSPSVSPSVSPSPAAVPSLSPSASPSPAPVVAAQPAAPTAEGSRSAETAVLAVGGAMLVGTAVALVGRVVG